jgi:hypothetical protein
VLCPNQTVWAFRFSECAETGVNVAGIPQADFWKGGGEAYFSKEEGLLIFTLVWDFDRKFHGNRFADITLTTQTPRSPDRKQPEIFFWRYTEVAAYDPPLSTTLPELPGRV